MNQKKKDILVIVLLVIGLIAINYGWLDDALDNFLTSSETIHVDRIIDGDTIYKASWNKFSRAWRISI